MRAHAQRSPPPPLSVASVSGSAYLAAPSSWLQSHGAVYLRSFLLSPGTAESNAATALRPALPPASSLTQAPPLAQAPPRRPLTRKLRPGVLSHAVPAPRAGPAPSAGPAPGVLSHAGPASRAGPAPSAGPAPPFPAWAHCAAFQPPVRLFVLSHPLTDARMAAIQSRRGMEGGEASLGEKRRPCWPSSRPSAGCVGRSAEGPRRRCPLRPAESAVAEPSLVKAACWCRAPRWGPCEQPLGNTMSGAPEGGEGADPAALPGRLPCQAPPRVMLTLEKHRPTCRR
ncbi:uncharacterized protein C10orf95-like [Petaurus breviceps papuanus]|uniref:uncharacterized protein C10orf95-like n=1 Tax=Petaurus breviceps papuanus TaxID=3040969 RepID=UPI0036DDB587